MQTLIIVAHPDLSLSLANKLLLQKLDNQNENVVIHNLYRIYPNGNINIHKEQELLESFDSILFQFPIYWFSCPSLLKKWFDEVLTYHWAYGRNSGYKLQNKKIGLIVSTGIEREKSVGLYDVDRIILPFKLTFDFLKVDFRGFFSIYGVPSNAVKSQNGIFKLERNINNNIQKVEDQLQGYLNFVRQFNS